MLYRTTLIMFPTLLYDYREVVIRNVSLRIYQFKSRKILDSTLQNRTKS